VLLLFSFRCLGAIRSHYILWRSYLNSLEPVQTSQKTVCAPVTSNSEQGKTLCCLNELLSVGMPHLTHTPPLFDSVLLLSAWRALHSWRGDAPTPKNKQNRMCVLLLLRNSTTRDYICVQARAHLATHNPVSPISSGLLFRPRCRD
jgi:hypothetical protein